MIVLCPLARLLKWNSLIESLDGVFPHLTPDGASMVSLVSSCKINAIEVAVVTPSISPLPPGGPSTPNVLLFHPRPDKKAFRCSLKLMEGGRGAAFGF